jgi:hypothetical protein
VAWGFEPADAPGMAGAFGAGEFGWDARWLAWLSSPLPPGSYVVSVCLEDPAGRRGESLDVPICLPSSPRPARDLAVASYQPDTDRLELTWSPSPDLA